MYADNDGRFPDDSSVLIRFPRSPEQTDRESWPWLPGHVLGQCGPIRDSSELMAVQR